MMHFQVVSDLNGVVGEAVGFSGRELTHARWQVGLPAIDGHLPWKTLGRLVTRYGGDHRIREFTCANQFRCLAFAQLTYRESLR